MKTAGTISISVALRSVVVALLGLIFMFLTSVVLTFLTIAILPFLLIALRIYSRLNKRYTREGLTASAEASTVAEEVFGSIRTVSNLPALLSLLVPRSSLCSPLTQLQTYGMSSICTPCICDHIAGLLVNELA